MVPPRLVRDTSTVSLYLSTGFKGKRSDADHIRARALGAAGIAPRTRPIGDPHSRRHRPLWASRGRRPVAHARSVHLGQFAPTRLRRVTHDDVATARTPKVRDQ